MWVLHHVDLPLRGVCSKLQALVLLLLQRLQLHRHIPREPAGIRHAIQQPLGAGLQQEAAPHLLALLLVGCVSGCHPEVSLRPSPCCHQRQRLFKQAALQLLRPDVVQELSSRLHGDGGVF